MPDPITQIVWDSWCEIHPDTAHQLGLETGNPAACVLQATTQSVDKEPAHEQKTEEQDG